MLDAIKAVFQDIKAGKNVDIYLTVLLSLVLAAWGLTDEHIEFPKLAAGILATLSLLALSTLNIRRAAGDIKTVLKETQSSQKLYWQSELVVNRDRMAKAHQLDWMAISLYKTTALFEYEIKECLRKGGQVRVLLVDPFFPSNLPDILSGQGYSTGSKERIGNNVEQTIDRVKFWKEEIPNAQVEVRLMSHIPPYGFTSYNRKQPDGYVRVRMFTYPKSNDIPALKISCVEDSRWHSFFVDQYEMYWANATDAFSKSGQKTDSAEA